MKKILLILIMLLFVTGCESKIEYTFDKNIKSDISINFTLNDYKNYTSIYYGNDFDKQEDSIIREGIQRSRKINAFVNNDSNLYKEEYFRANNDNYEARYTFNYTYSNFSKNNILNYCFEYFNVREDKDAYYVSLNGKSSCSNMELIINADNRMINSNSKNKSGNKYIWNINKDNNDIYFAISKNEMTSDIISPLYIILAIIGIVVAILVYIVNNKIIKREVRR